MHPHLSSNAHTLAERHRVKRSCLREGDGVLSVKVQKESADESMPGYWVHAGWEGGKHRTRVTVQVRPAEMHCAERRTSA